MRPTDMEPEAGLKARDPAALEALMNLYGADLYRLVGRILGALAPKEDVEECVSDAFIAAWRNFEDYDRARGTLGTWLHILAKYKALDYRRRLLARPPGEALTGDWQATDDPAREAMLKAEAEQVIRLAEKFRPVDREIFWRRYFYYEDMVTIAQATGLTLKAVENRLRRARLAIRDRLAAERKEELS